MTWLTWRLQRTEFVLLGILALAITGMLLATHGEVARLAGACTDFECRVSISNGPPPEFVQASRLYRVVLQGLGWFNFLPLIAALLLVLPILSELESGSYRLAWTQSVTRWRWTSFRVGSLVLGGVLFALVFGVAFNWWTAPRDSYIGRLGQDSYDLRGIAPVGHTLFAIGITLAVGVIIRRPGITIALSVLAYMAIRLPFMIFALPHLRTPLTRAITLDGAPDQQDWILSSYWVDATGKRFNEEALQTLCPVNAVLSRVETGDGLRDCIARNGLTHYLSYQPDSRFWSFQLIETGIFLAASAALIGFVAWYLLRRVE